MRLVLDRIENTQDGKKIVVFEGDTASYDILEENMPVGFIESLEVGMILEADIVDGNLMSPRILADETNKKRQNIKSRLNNLFNRNKND